MAEARSVTADTFARDVFDYSALAHVPSQGGSVRQGNSMRHCNNSMQLTRAADYGIRVMIQLAKLPDHERALLPDLAIATETPGSFLSKVLQSLTRAQLINSRRGKAGGFPFHLAAELPRCAMLSRR